MKRKDASVRNRSFPDCGQSLRESIFSSSFFFPRFRRTDSRIHPSHPHASFSHPQTAKVIHAAVGRTTSFFLSSNRALNFRGKDTILCFAERFRSATRRTMLIRKTDDCPRCAVATGSTKRRVYAPYANSLLRRTGDQVPASPRSRFSCVDRLHRWSPNSARFAPGILLSIFRAIIAGQKVERLRSATAQQGRWL